MIKLSNAIDELRRIIEEAEFEGFFSMDDIVDLTNDLEKAFLKGAEIVKPIKSRSMPSSRHARKRPAMKKRRPTGKSKILNEMAKKKWNAYKKKFPKGKRTYIDIRSQVSRSQEYKRKVKKL